MVTRKKILIGVFLLIGLSSQVHAKVQQGLASYYHSKFEGRKTANGERYSNHKLTAAHRTLPIGTRVRVTNLSNNKSVVVRINDRGPFVKNRILDISRAGARELDMEKRGLAKVKIEILAKN